MEAEDQEKSHLLYGEGRTAMDSHDLLTAIEKFKESVKLSPHFKTYELLGECLLGAEKAVEASLYLSAAVGLGKKEFRARFLLAKALLCIGNREIDAVEKLDEALAINPSYQSAKELRAKVLGENEWLAKKLAEEER